MKTRPALPLLASLALAGCASEPLALQEDVTYIAEWVGEAPVIGRRQLSLTLNEGRAYGSTGCNHWYAAYTRDGRQIRFSELGSTRKACPPALAEQEQRYLSLLQRVERWDVSRIDQLRLWPSEGAPLRFWPAQD